MIGISIYAIAVETLLIIGVYEAMKKMRYWIARKHLDFLET